MSTSLDRQKQDDHPIQRMNVLLFDIDISLLVNTTPIEKFFLLDPRRNCFLISLF